MPAKKNNNPNIAYTATALALWFEAVLPCTKLYAAITSPTMPKTVRMTPNALFSMLLFRLIHVLYCKEHAFGLSLKLKA